MTLITRPGIWSDVLYDGQQFIGCYVTVANQNIVARVRLSDGVDLPAWPEASEPPLYLRVCWNPLTSLPEAVGQGAITGHLLHFDGTAWHDTGIATFGQNCVGIGWDGRQTVLYAQTSGTTYLRGETLTTVAQSFPVPVWPGGDGSTTQGWLDVFPGATAALDQLDWTDPGRISTHGDLTLICAVLRGPVWLGQCSDPAGILGYNDATGQEFYMAPQGFEPHLCQNRDYTAWAGATRQLNGVCAFEVFPPFPAVPAQPEPPVTVPTLPKLPRKLVLFPFKLHCNVGNTDDARFTTDMRELPWSEDAPQQKTIGPLTADYDGETHDIFETFPQEFRRAVFSSAEAGSEFFENWEESVISAYESGVAVIANLDGRSWQTVHMHNLAVSVANLTDLTMQQIVVPEIEVYPQDDLEAKEIYRRKRNEINFLRDSYGFTRISLVAPFYQQKTGAGVPAWDETFVVSLHPLIHALCAEFPEVVALGLFPYHREGDGIANSQTMAALAEQWLSANDVPGHENDLALLPSVPVPPDPPVDPPPVIIPPGGTVAETPEQKLERITAILAIGGGFCKTLDEYQERYRQTVIEVSGIPDYTEADAIKHHIERKGFLYK